jgi:NTE family protein
VTGTTAFVLGGGGKWGAVEVGMLEALTEAGITPDVVVGTSIGAINGAVYSADPTIAGVATMRRMWTEVAASDLLGGTVTSRLGNLARLRPSIHDQEGLSALLGHWLAVERFDQLRLPFQCVAASIERAAEQWFADGPLMPALLASSAVPGLFPPVEIGGEHFYDGGLVDSVPIDRAVRLGASTVYVLQVGRLEQPLRPPTRLHEAVLVAFEIARRHRFGTLMDTPPEGVTIHVLPSGNVVTPDDPRQLRWRDIGAAAALADGAYRASTDYLAGARP